MRWIAVAIVALASLGGHSLLAQGLKHPQGVAAVKKVDTAKALWLKSIENCVDVLNGLADKVKTEAEQAAIKEKVAHLEAEAEWVRSDPELAEKEDKPQRGILADVTRPKIGMNKEQVLKAIGRAPDSTSTRKGEGDMPAGESLTWDYQSIAGEGNQSSNRLSVTLRAGRVQIIHASVYEHAGRR